MSTSYRTTLLGKKLIAEDTTELSLRRPEGFEFRAGQYLQLAVPQLVFPDPLGHSRLLSIASSPADQSELHVAFRNSDSGFKRSLAAFTNGDTVEIEGPHGFFAMPEQSDRPLVFVAGGIGITAFMGMLRNVAESGYDGRVTVLYANTSRQRAAYYKDLEKLAKSTQTVSVVHTYDRITSQFIEQSIGDPTECLWYIAGPPTMVSNVRNMLFMMGVDEDQLRYEEFTGY